MPAPDKSIFREKPPTGRGHRDPLSRLPSGHLIRGLRTTEPSKKDGSSSWCRGVAREKGVRKLVSVALVSVAARYGASEALLSVIMVFCRLYAPSLHPCKEEGRKGGAHTREAWQNATRTQAYKGRNLIPFFHPPLALSLNSSYAVCSPSLVYSFALSSPDSSVAVFLSPGRVTTTRS